jgi:hypothetical protein
MRRLAAVAVLLLAGTPCLAHELGNIRARIVLEKGGGFRVRLVVDREHLPPGFGADAPAAAGPLIDDLPEQLEPRLGGILRAAARGARISYDGGLAPFRARLIRPEGMTESEAIAHLAQTAEVSLELSGEAPPDARQFTFANSAQTGAFLLVLEVEGDPGVYRTWLEPGKASAPFVLGEALRSPSRGEVFRRYLALGFTHIVPKGLDHILFVLGLFFLSPRWKPLLWQVTAFTLAHTLTLALSVYGVVSLPSSIVEPAIALSILFVAVENVVVGRLTPWRPAVVFLFGLLHGLGFAGVLTELGLPRSQFLTALLAFNVGVEAGQLAVILLAAIALALPWGRRPWYRRRIEVPASLAIGAVAIVWFVQRVAAGG